MRHIYRGRAAHPSTSLPVSCGSSAPINVLGRVVNGGRTEDPMSVCSGYASWLNIRGNFIHIELDSEGRKSDVAPVVGAALKAAYTPTLSNSESTPSRFKGGKVSYTDRSRSSH